MLDHLIDFSKPIKMCTIKFKRAAFELFFSSIWYPRNKSSKQMSKLNSDGNTTEKLVAALCAQTEYRIPLVHRNALCFDVTACERRRVRSRRQKWTWPLLAHIYIDTVAAKHSTSQQNRSVNSMNWRSSKVLCFFHFFLFHFHRLLFSFLIFFVFALLLISHYFRFSHAFSVARTIAACIMSLHL